MGLNKVEQVKEVKYGPFSFLVASLTGWKHRKLFKKFDKLDFADLSM